MTKRQPTNDLFFSKEDLELRFEKCVDEMLRASGVSDDSITTLKLRQEFASKLEERLPKVLKGDTLVIRADLLVVPHHGGIKLSSNAPYVGKLLICLFVQPDKQQDRLADFEEKLNTLWIPNFGMVIGRFVYLGHAIRSAGSVWKIAATTTMLDWIIRLFNRFWPFN
jgi:hypothetical protein